MAGTALPGRLKWWTGEVTRIVRETPTASSLILNVPGWLGHRAGQHVDVHLTAEDGYQAVRSYSIASAPADDHLMLTIERLEDGEVSPYLVDDVAPGDSLELLGPIGGYFIWDAEMRDPLLLIAGGSGVVPLRAMARQRALTKSDVPTRFLYSARTADALIYRSELDNLAASDVRFELTYTLTRAQPPGWTGYARRVDAAMLREVAWSPEDHPAIYLCGPTTFVEVVADQLVALGHDPARIRIERFGPTGV
ncbi:MAG TPA: ferredoxin reductase [Nitrolancea sp.]|nr:ferredoxin reductase [Nitrolancea sp.]